MTTNLRTTRLSLARSFMRDSVQPHLSQHGRVTAAFEAGYLATLAALDVDTGAYEHPRPQVLRDGLLLLSKDLSTGFEHALFFLEHRYAPDKLGRFDLQAMRAWAAAVIEAAGR
jgi:hypothetical protein